MITSKDMFQIVLTDSERERAYRELYSLLPPMTSANTKKYPQLYELRAALRQNEE